MNPQLNATVLRDDIQASARSECTELQTQGRRSRLSDYSTVGVLSKRYNAIAWSRMSRCDPRTIRKYYGHVRCESL